MHGICFIEPMFHKVVCGEKTRFSEIIKPQPKDSYRIVELNCIEDGKETKYYGFYTKNQYDKLTEWDKNHPNYTFMGKEYNRNHFAYPRYKLGETLYLKEPFKFSEYTDFRVDLTTKYSAITREISWVEVELEYGIKHDDMDDIINSIYRRQEKSKDGWLNKLFMPEWCAENFIEITGVRAEKLQEISRNDCIKEGIEITDNPKIIGYPFGVPFPYINGVTKNTDGKISHYSTAKDAYAALIDSIHKKGVWKSNPFVWCYSFKLTNKKQ
jgi:hypothetical protein